MSLLIARVKFEPESSSSPSQVRVTSQVRVEFTHSTSQVRARVKFESRAKFESGSIFLFFEFFLLFISYGCYFRLHNDVLVANKKNYKCLVCNIAIFFIIDRLSHYCYGSLSLYKDIPHTYLMKFLRRLTPVFAYTWSRDSISAAEKVHGEGDYSIAILFTSTGHPR